MAMLTVPVSGSKRGVMHLGDIVGSRALVALSAKGRVVLGVCLAVCFCTARPTAAIAESADVAGRPGPIGFDIPAQALSTALEAFSASSGYQILMSDGGFTTVRSTTVQGAFSPREALVRMVAGTGLAVRFTAAKAAILVPDVSRPSTRNMPMPLTGSLARETAHYEAALQDDVIHTLCRDAITRPGNYRAALDIWVTSSGRVERAELLAPTGDPDRDERILRMLRALDSAAPPPGLLRPTTLLIVPTASSDAARGCAAPVPSDIRRAARP